MDNVDYPHIPSDYADYPSDFSDYQDIPGHCPVTKEQEQEQPPPKFSTFIFFVRAKMGDSY